MSEENKPRRSMLSNLFWCLRRLCDFAPYGLIGFALLIPVNIALEYLNVYLPALAVTEVTNGSAAAAALERVGWVMGGLMLLALCKAALELIKSRAIGVSIVGNAPRCTRASRCPCSIRTMRRRTRAIWLTARCGRRSSGTSFSR